LQGKIWICAAETGKEVDFEGADRSFCGICSMDIRRYQFKRDVLLVKVHLKDSGVFVVQPLELGPQSCEKRCLSMVLNAFKLLAAVFDGMGFV
jgi:hypothetical protein